jgi:hypothetical protein
MPKFYHHYQRGKPNAEAPPSSDIANHCDEVPKPYQPPAPSTTLLHYYDKCLNKIATSLAIHHRDVRFLSVPPCM